MFLTSKIDPGEISEVDGETARRMLHAHTTALGTDYLDLLLLHGSGTICVD